MKICIFLCTFLHAVHSITIYDARLTSGRSGVVEVLTHQGWLPVCRSSSSYWSTPESRVLCRQLGYDVTSNPSTGSSSSYSTSLVFDFSCTGNELQLSDCSYRLVNSYTSSSCSPGVTVSCAQCGTEGSVQLRGGVIPEAGTVEFCSGGIWTAVCDSNWDYKDAFVVCRELGLPATEVSTYSQSYFGDHHNTYGMYFNCFGNETSLNNCQKSATTCDFANVAGIYCTGDVITARCFEGILRLVDGRDENEGRIEICSNGVWGTIYAGNWDVNDASVICTQLGYHQYSRVEALQVSNGYFRAGTGPILYGNLQCTGTESRLTECSSNYNHVYYATHSSDAGVRCQRTDANIQVCDNGEARLVNGSTASEGRVEICYAGIWGSVCDSGWGNRDAAIICMQLGFQGTNATALRRSYFGDGDGPYHLSNVGCSGEERTLLECSNPFNIGYHTCTPGHDAGVRCDASICMHNDLHLFDADIDYQYGVAEICINGFWADICYNSGSYATIASKFCNEYLGINSSSFGELCCPGIRRNTGNLTLYDVSCSGSSDFFTEDCSYRLIPGYSSGGCNLQNELIIGCYSQSMCTQNDIRLVGGNSSLEGRVEICYESLWGAITYYGFSWRRPWDANDAMVACRQLGLPWEWALADQINLFGQGNSRTVAAGYECTGSEQQLSSCSLATYVSLSSGTNYQSYPTASVICQGDTSRPTECEHGDVRLADGETEMEGRVEFCSYGYWAVACDTNWDKGETTAVCKQLGFPTEGSEFVLRSVFGSNYLLPLIGLSCGSGVNHISECQFYNQTSGCNHRRTAGIICKERNQHYQINIHVAPEQETYDIGSMVTLNCTATPSPHKYRNYEFPVTYFWYNYNRGSWSTSSSHTTFTIPLSHSRDHYCSIYRNGFFLGTGIISLHVRSVLQVNSTKSSLAKIDAGQGQNITLQIDTVDHDVVKSLLELTWYHNDTLLIPGQDQRFSLSDNNKTLMITNFTSTYTGVYKAQFNQLFVHPYSEECKNELLSLMRSHHLLKPAIFCVNIKDCSESEEAQNRVTISVQNSNTQGMLPRNLSFKAEGIVSNSRILKHASFVWYRNGYQISPSISSCQKYYNNLSFSEEFSLVNTSYEHTGRYEVRLQLGASSYFRESGCQSYYDRFVALYLGSLVTIASDHTDIYYSRGLILDFDGENRAATRDEGATLTCRASIDFPPFSMLSLIKNGQTVATSSSGLIETNTKSINANPFGLYDCRLNASGAIFKKSSLLEEQVTLRMTIDSGRSNICRGRAESVIKEALLLKITNECRCTFGPTSIHDSSADCNSGQEIAYSATIQYSNEDGSETASTITERIVGQVPFTMTVTGESGEEVAVTVTSACVDCRALVLTAAAGGGLFVGGFATAALIAAVSIVIVILVIRRRRRTAAELDTARHEISKESKADTTRYTAPASRPAAAAGGAKKLKPQQQQQPQQQKKKPLASAGNQPQRKPARVDPKTLYDTPRAQKQTAGMSESGRSAGPSKSAATQKMEMSDDKDMYEALDAERESIYEETF